MTNATKERVLAFPSDVAFSPAVKRAQVERGSRALYDGVEQGGGWRTVVDARLAAFLAETRSAFFATASADGQPYVQHRGGPAGFIKVVDETTLGFADYAGNRQYISVGNLTENPKAQLFLIDYARRRRIKIWGTAKTVEGESPILQQLVDPHYEEWPERAVLFSITAWDINCPQHIPQRFEADQVEALLRAKDAQDADQAARLAELEAENARLRDEIRVLEHKSWLREGCAGAGDFEA